jgi:tetratricopeptide (TPR) repeat protein
MGPTYEHIHHYCRAQMLTNRANLAFRKKTQAAFFLETSLGEFDYVIKLAPPDFVLLPEILTRKGQNLLRLGKSQGVAELTRAIELKRDYWPPYAAISDYYQSLGDRKRAREWLEKGLAAVPGTRALTRRLDELDSTKDQPKSPPKPAKEADEPKPAEGKPPAKKG